MADERNIPSPFLSSPKKKGEGVRRQRKEKRDEREG
jgi:hypothetical protein